MSSVYVFGVFFQVSIQVIYSYVMPGCCLVMAGAFSVSSVSVVGVFFHFVSIQVTYS